MFEKTMQARRSTEIAAVAALMLIGLAIRAQHLSSPFYYDEAVYVNLAQHPFHSDFYPDRVFFRHPPAHYLLLAAWGSLAGYGEIAMRLPSLLFAAATIMLVYFLGRRLMSRQAALAATFLLAINVLHQQYSPAATMYAMLTFLMTLCIYGMLSGNEWLVASGFIGAIYTHYFGFYLAPPLLLFYYRLCNHDWKKIAGKVGLYVAAYSPWLVIALQGLEFHAHRTRGLHWWDFQWLNIIRQLSLILLVGAIYFSFAQRRKYALQPALLLGGLFLAFAFFLIPFHRYLVPFLPVLIVFGVAGLAELEKRIAQRWPLQNRISRVAIWAAMGVALAAPNPEAYGIYPAMGRHIDWRDAIHTQEWRRIVAIIPAGKVATPNARSLLFYSNLPGMRQYKVEQFNEDKREFASLMEREENDWIVLPKYALYAALIQLADNSERYHRFAEFDYTIIYRKNFISSATPRQNQPSGAPICEAPPPSGSHRRPQI